MSTHGTLPTREALLSRLVLATVMQAPCHLRYSVSSPLTGQADAVWPKAHLRDTLSGRMLQGLGGSLPRAGQGPVLSLECAGFSPAPRKLSLQPMLTAYSGPRATPAGQPLSASTRTLLPVSGLTPRPSALSSGIRSHYL